jgi:hypothetical protein
MNTMHSTKIGCFMQGLIRLNIGHMGLASLLEKDKKPPHKSSKAPNDVELILAWDTGHVDDVPNLCSIGKKETGHLFAGKTLDEVAQLAQKYSTKSNFQKLNLSST